MMTIPDIRQDNTKLAIMLILVTVLALSFGDALIKKTSADLVLWQIFVLRSLLAIPVLLLVLRVSFPSISYQPLALFWTIARSVMLTMMWVFYYISLPHVPLAVAAAAFYTLPIFIALFSAALVGERVTIGGWFAIALGFAGVTLILKPTATNFNFYALLPLVSAVLYALAMILTRTKCRSEHPMVLSLTLNITFIAVGLLATLVLPVLNDTGAPHGFLSPTWVSPGIAEITAITVLAVAILIGSIGTAIAYQIGESSVVGVFDFAYVGFAVVWGLLFFAEIPDGVAAIGMLMIVAAGVIAVRQ